MPTYDPQLLGIKPCICGRLSNKIHCSHCGSYTIYGLSTKASIPNPITGRLEEFVIYRCRRCSLYFNDNDWQNDNCHAPLTLRKSNVEEVKTQSVISKIGTRPLNNSEMEMLLQRAKKMRMNIDASKKALDTLATPILPNTSISKIAAVGVPELKFNNDNNKQEIKDEFEINLEDLKD